MTKESSLLNNDESHSNTTPMKKSTSGQRLTGQRALSANWDKKAEPDGGTELNGGTLEDADNDDYAADDEAQQPMNQSKENEVRFFI